MTLNADVGEGDRKYIRIDRDREHMMRWEADGVTSQGVSWAASTIQCELTGHGGYKFSILSIMSAYAKRIKEQTANPFNLG